MASTLSQPKASQQPEGFFRSFVTHPASVGESYLGHFAFALKFAARLLGAGGAALVHAFIPALFETTASDLIKKMHAEIPLERIIVLPDHSLLEQSQNATEAKLAVNGDGFGVAWYDGEARPGLYRDVLPAWSDGNLPDLCRMVRSKLFLAHVRASTVGETSRTNCHPFRSDQWTFMHNGQIGGFGRIKRALEQALPDKLYKKRKGSTDSEMFFLTLLANGLNENPEEAANRSIAIIKDLQGDESEPNRITCALSDGKAIYAFRYSSDGQAPSLYIGKDLDSGGCVLASEPLDATIGRWRKIEELEFIEVGGEAAKVECLAA